MTDNGTAGARPIAQTGEAEWFPPAEDDREALAVGERSPRRGFLFGPGGLKWGWALALFLVVTGCLMTLFITGLVLTHVLRPGVPSNVLLPGRSALVEGAQFAAVLATTALLAWLERRRMGRYGLGRFRAAQAAIGAFWGLLLLSLLVGALWALGLLQFSAPRLHGAAAWQWGAFWLLPFVLTGLFEETGFRGAMQLCLTRGFADIPRGERSLAYRKTFGFWMGALLLALMFGGIHLQNKGEAATGALSAGLIGLVFSFSLWRTGSLWWAVGFHAAWDWAESFLYGVSDSGTVAVHRLFDTTPVGNALLSGGTVGPEGSLLVLPVAAFAALVVWWTLPSEPGSPSDARYVPDGQ